MRGLFVTVVWIAWLLIQNTFAEDARVLPAGRSRLSFIYAQTGQVSQDFNGLGEKEPILKTYQLDRFDLDAVNARKLDPRISEYVDAINGLTKNFRYDERKKGARDHGIVAQFDADYDPNLPKLGDALARGSIEIQAKGQLEQYMYAFQHGLTDKISVGFMVPYVKSHVDVRADITGNNSAADLYEALDGLQIPELVEPANYIRKINETTFQDVLKDKGYERFASSQQAGVGDLVFGLRYNYLNRQNQAGEFIHSVQAGATAPTGRTHRPSEITMLDLGSGTWDIPLAHIMNYSPHWRVMFSNGFHYTWRAKSYRAYRIKSNPDDLMPDAASEENVAQYLGDKIWTNLGARIYISRGIYLESSYEWYVKRQDKFYGSRSDRDYSYLADKTDLYSETANIGLSLSSVPAFLNKSFIIPGDIALNYFWPTRGRNAIIAPYGTLELALYF